MRAWRWRAAWPMLRRRGGILLAGALGAFLAGLDSGAGALAMAALAAGLVAWLWAHRARGSPWPMREMAVAGVLSAPAWALLGGGVGDSIANPFRLNLCLFGSPCDPQPPPDPSGAHIGIVAGLAIAAAVAAGSAWWGARCVYEQTKGPQPPPPSPSAGRQH